MLIEAARSCLLVIDMQERLMAAVQNAEAVIANAHWLMRIATRLGVPVVISEQYPQGLGPTVTVLKETIHESMIMTKTHFSCTTEPACQDRIAACNRDQFIVLGAEAHVCVLQTALGLRAQGKAVYVMADGVASRRAEDRELALTRLRDDGVRVVSREMVAFEWLERAGTNIFKTISREFLR